MTTPDPALPLGAFSISLSVKDLTRSLAFYEVLGFRPIAGAAAAKWLTYLDAVVLALLHGAHVPDLLNLPVPSHRGFSAADGRAEAEGKATSSSIRVLVPSTDSVSGLGMDIYSSKSVRPLLIDWLVASIQKQAVQPTDRFVIFHAN